MKTASSKRPKRLRTKRINNTLNSLEKKDLFPKKTKLAEDILKKFPPPEDLMSLK